MKSDMVLKVLLLHDGDFLKGYPDDPEMSDATLNLHFF